MKLVAPTANTYKNSNWIVLPDRWDKLRIVETNENWTLEALKVSVPWGLVKAEIPVSHWLGKVKLFQPMLDQLLTDATLIAMAPELLRQNERLHARNSVLENYLKHYDVHYQQNPANFHLVRK